MATSPSPPDAAPLAVPLAQFVEARHASVRLCNAIRGATREGVLPFATAQDYLADPNARVAMMRRVKNLGARSASELDRIVRLARSDGGHFAVVDPMDVVTSDEVDAMAEVIAAELCAVPTRVAIGDVRDGGRLDRVLESAVGDIPVWTLCVDFQAAHPGLSQVPSVGEKTVEDLRAGLRIVVSRALQMHGARRMLHDAAIRRFFGSEDGPIWIPEPLPDAEEVAGSELVRELLDDMTVAQAFCSEVLAARLQQLVLLPQVSSLLVADLLLDRHNWNLRLGRFGNIGRTTVLGFWNVCWRRLAAAARDLDAAERERLAKHLVTDPDHLVPRGDDLLALAVSEGDDCAEMAARVEVPTELGALVDFLFERIQARDAPIIRRRFGLDTGTAETLEEIGAEIGVTRERIRQIEKRGLRDMALMARRVPLRQAIDDRALQTWRELVGDDFVLLEADLHGRRRRVAGATMLGLELLGLALADWLDETGGRFEHGWLQVGVDRTEIDRAIGRLRTQGLPALPCAIEDLGLDFSASLSSAVLQLGLGLRAQAGYVVEGRFGVRPRRKLGLHAVLSASRSPVPSAELLRRYRAAVPTDRCSTRDLSILMDEARHLFLEISEERWIALGRAGSVPDFVALADEDDGEPQALPEVDGSLAAILTAELERGGPQALGQLTANPRRYLPRERSVNSIGPTLIMRPDLFVRLLPGIYCLPQQVPTHEQVITGDVPYLLDDWQARLLALARRAGVPWGTFPLWTPAAEMRLCRWAERSGDGEVLRSLLAVASVEAWPADPADLARWRDLQQRESRFDLFTTLRPQALETCPELDRLLAALVDLEEQRTTNWMALNRVDGRRIDAHSGCALLATLVMLGAVSAPGQREECAWQLPHPIVADRTSALRSMLAEELHRAGSLEWSSPSGATIAFELRSSQVTPPSWLDIRRFRGAFDAVAEPERSTTDQVSMDDVSAVGSRLLAERRMGDFLGWLGAQ